MVEKTYRIHIKHGDFELDVEGDQKFVESCVEAFLADGLIGNARAKKRPAPTTPTKSALPKKEKVERGSKKKKGHVVNKDKLKKFMNGKTLNSHRARYLEYIRFWDSVGVTKVKSSDILACYKAEGVPVGKSARQALTILKQQGLLNKLPLARGVWMLTEAGKKAGPDKAKTRKKPGRKVGTKGSRERKPPKPLNEVLGIPAK